MLLGIYSIQVGKYPTKARADSMVPFGKMIPCTPRTLVILCNFEIKCKIGTSPSFNCLRTSQSFYLLLYQGSLTLN